MATLPNRRRVALFLAAIVLPSTVIVAIGLRMIVQERELAEKRLADDRRDMVADLRQALLTELERITFEELAAVAPGTARQATYHHPAVRLVGEVEGRRLLLPWESDPTTERARASLGNPAFAQAIALGERAELGRRDFESAIASYRRALAGTTDPTQMAYARLLMARALLGSRRPAAATREYETLLPSTAGDEHGVPFAFYAAGQLIDAGRALDAVEERLAGVVASDVWLAPAAVYLLRDLLGRLRADGSDATRSDRVEALTITLMRRVEATEMALGLQRDFDRLFPEPMESDAPRGRVRWLAYGDGAWLVSTRSAGAQHGLVAVDVNDMFKTVTGNEAVDNRGPGEFRFLVGADAPGEPLGSAFPDIRVEFLTDPDLLIAQEIALRNSYYLAALVLVLGGALFGGYLLLRDVRRESRVARMRSDFVASVSHELKTPLTAIRMFAETLRIRDRPDPKMQTEYLDTIVGESERLTRLLNNVLDLSKIEQGQKIYRRELTSLPDIANRAARALQYPLAQDGFHLNVEANNGVPPVSADGDAIEQAILNLLTNAMKYSDENREIDLRVRATNGHAVISVVDRGVGIPAKLQERLTEKFYRVRSAENDRIPGTGLGLTIVQHTARAHGGYLTIESAIGEGSTFSIHLPLEETTA